METIEQMYNEAKALVEDRTYNIGEISEKTGLQKTANGWRTPKGNKIKEKNTEKKAEHKPVDNWEETRMASGKIYDTPDKSYRIIERKDIDTGESTFDIRNLKNDRAEDIKGIKSLKEAKAFVEKHYGDTKAGNPYALSKEEKNEAMKNPKTRLSQKYDEVIKSKKGTPQYNTALEEYTKERESYKNSQGVEALKEFPVVPISKDSACRITADTIIKLKNVVEDRTYQIGEISEKTGLQKTANGWVKPKSNNGKSSPTPEVKKEIGLRKAAMNGGTKERKALFKFEAENADDEQLKYILRSKNQPADRIEMYKAELEKRNKENGPKENGVEKKTSSKSLKLPDEKSSFQTDVNRMKKLKKEDYKQYTIQLEKLHSKYPINKWKDLYNKTVTDTACRITADTKIRLKK